MTNYLELAALLICLFIGWNHPHKLIYLFIYTYPYIAGNTIIGIQPPKFVPSVSISFALVGIGFIRWNYLYKTSKLARISFIILLYICIVTIVGLIHVPQDYLSSWSQAPLTRAIRILFRETLFWMLPVFVYYMILATNKAVELGQAFVNAGIFYCSLGILQYLIAFTTGVDIFPIIREAGSLQSVASIGLESRITSICGEPRYLSSMSSLWFIVTVLLGKQLNFSFFHRVVSGGLFLATLILSGSRTGSYSICIVFLAILLIQFFSRATLISWSKSIVLVVLATILFSFLLANSSNITQRSFDKQLNTYYGKQVEIGPVSITIEPQDYLIFNGVFEEPLSIIIGLGAGLAQYYYNPLADFGTVLNFGDSSSIDSQRPNFSLIHLVTSYGLIGLFLFFNYYKEFSISCVERADQELGNTIPWMIVVLCLLVQLMKLNDLYGQIALFTFMAGFHTKKINEFCSTYNPVQISER